MYPKYPIARQPIGSNLSQRIGHRTHCFKKAFADVEDDFVSIDGGGGEERALNHHMRITFDQQFVFLTAWLIFSTVGNDVPGSWCLENRRYLGGKGEMRAA